MGSESDAGRSAVTATENTSWGALQTRQETLLAASGFRALSPQQGQARQEKHQCLPRMLLTECLDLTCL